VAISDSTTLSNDNQITCSMMSSEGVTWYECPDAPFARYVHVYTAGEKHPKCLIQAFSTYFPACGDRHKTNPTSGAFFNHEFNRGPNKYEEPQSIQFAPKGCTNTACMCSIDYAGVLCNSGVSSIEMDLDGKLSKRVCRETMQPPGGSSKFSKDGTCECNSITTDDSTGIAGEVKGFFYGDSCACASLFVKSRNEHRSCAGHGQCVTPNFPWGRPIYDVNDFENDPLSNPFVRDLGNGVNNFRYTIVNREEDLSPNEDPRSVLSINGESWFFSEGQDLEFRRAFQDISTCAVTVNTPVTIVYDGTDTELRALPSRAQANITVWTLQPCGGGSYAQVPECTETSVTYEQCDPSVFGDCSTTTYCHTNWTTAGEIDASHFYDTLFEIYPSSMCQCDSTTRGVTVG